LSGAAPDPHGTEVDRDNPWPGLSSFTEDLKSFFFGREKETEELVRLVRRNTLTVLFGQSGLGKSSLLQAGVFPVLREADFLPLYLRLDHEPSTPPLADQVKAALVDAFKSAGADAPAPRPDESLWEYFHRKDIDIWSAKNRLLTPVLAFDQFEEIFTLGRADDARRERGRAFLTELADLVENRPPAALRAKFDSGELDPARYAFDKPSCQVILSLREDFLPDLEGLKNEMRSLMHSRMRVRRLTGTQAIEIVTRPAPHLLAEGVAERVVEFVAGGRGGSLERLAELEVEPALLSVICRELNQRRRALGQEQITADLVSGNRREILNDFYERSVSDLPPAMREFVEDHLLTKSGFRDNLALETVLEAPGVTRALVDTLVSRRLLRIEDRLGVQRVELTHDVLADVIRASRDSRQQRIALEQARVQERRARRRVWWLRAIAAGLVVLLAGVSGLAYRAVKARDRQAVSAAKSDLEFASQLLERGDAPAAIARMVRAAQTDPENPVVGTRLISALARRSWPIWRDTGVVLPSPGVEARFLPDGKGLLVLGRDGVVRLLDARTFQLIREFRLPAKADDLLVSKRNSEVFVVGLQGGGGAAVTVATGGWRRFVTSDGQTQWSLSALSPDGKWLALAASSKIEIIDTAQGRVWFQRIFERPHNPSSMNFSADSRRLVHTDWNYGAEIVSVPTGASLMSMRSPSGHGFGAAYADFSPDGASCVMSWWDGARLFDSTTGVPIGPVLEHDHAQIEFALFEGDGRRLLTMGNDRTVRIWDAATGVQSLPPLRHGAAVNGGLLSRDGRILLTRSNDDFVHIWDTATGKPIVEPTMSIQSGAAITLDPAGDHVVFCAPDGRLVILRTIPSAARPVVWETNSGKGADLFVYYFPIANQLGRWGSDGARPEAFSLDSFGPVPPPFHDLPANLIVEDYNEKSGLYLARTLRMFSLWRNAAGVPVKIKDIVDSPLHSGGEFLGDSGLLMIGTGEGSGASSIRVWRQADGLPAGPALSTSGTISLDSVILSPDGARLSFGTNNGVAGLWDIATGREVVRLKTDSKATTHLMRFSPDGSMIATGSYEDAPLVNGVAYANARLWDAQTGEPLSPEYRHRQGMVGVAFSKDGALAAFASADGTVDIVSTATGNPACARLEHPDALLSGIAEAQSMPLTAVGASSLMTATANGLFLWDSRSGLPAMEPVSAFNQPIFLSYVDARETCVALIGRNGRATIWPLPPRYDRGAVPPWLLRLARALAGKRLDDNGTLVPSGAGFEQTEKELGAVQRDLAALPDDAPYAAWGRWILADPDRRAIAPGLNITLAEARARGLSGD
jgi:WD40 repeat protein